MPFRWAFLQNAYQNVPLVRQSEKAKQALHAIVERHLNTLQLEPLGPGCPVQTLNSETFAVPGLNLRHRSHVAGGDQYFAVLSTTSV